MKISSVLILATMALAVLGGPDDDNWANFKAKLSKRYNPNEEAQRKIEFIKTQRAIEKHNKENRLWKMGHNMFSDMTIAERKARLGLVVSNQNQTRSARVSRSLETLNRAALPAFYDYRETGCIPPVKDQGSCGSCWAFASVTPVEYALCNRKNVPVSLSEQQIVSCTPFAGGCNGGNNEVAWNYMKTQGLATTCAYPYTSGKSSLNGVCLDEYAMSTVKVASFGWADPSVPVNADIVAQSLMTYGPLGAGFAVINSFFSYSGGVYDDPDCNLVGGNHAVVIVGFGTTPEGVPYWIVRNSWGIGWGQSGYFLIRKGVDRCHIEHSAQYITIV